MENTLFPLPEEESSDQIVNEPGKPRLNRPNREQIEWRPISLNSMLPENHEVRMVWAWVEEMDLSPIYEKIRSVEGEAGRNAIDPAIFMGLWLYATITGVGSARQLEKLCKEHLAYMWLCGGVSVNYHSLADFRVNHEEYLEQLLIKSIAALQAEGLVTMEQVAQDGKKIRASAGSGSFHRKETLEKHLQQARKQVEQLRQELDKNPNLITKGQAKARERAACERQERLEKAKKQLEEMEKRAEETGRARENKKKGKEHRASITDPEARVMKMANGGFNPAYNAQFCTDTESNIIVWMDVTQQGNDTGLGSKMLDDVEGAHGKYPDKAIMDTGYFSRDEVVKIAQKGCVPFIAIPGKAPNKDTDYRYIPKKNDQPEVSEFRVRMGKDEAKERLIVRGAVAELVHAVMDQCNLSRMRVRGVEKVRTVLLWFVLAHNWLRTRLLHERMALSVVV